MNTYNHPTTTTNRAKARALILPIVAKRKALRAQLTASGASADELNAAVKNDGLEWFERMAAKGDGRPYHPELAQITLSVAAIHTTSDLLTQLILDIAAHPAIVPALREEIVRVLGTQGWRKTSLYRLKLLDSCIRETQRLKPIGVGELFPLFFFLSFPSARLFLAYRGGSSG